MKRRAGLALLPALLAIQPPRVMAQEEQPTFKA